MLFDLLMLTAIFCSSGRSETSVEKPVRLTNFPLANKLHNAANPGDKNYLVSPYAIELTLFMLYLGTSSNSPTAEQIKEHGLGLGKHEAKRGAYFRSLVDSLTGDSSDPDGEDTVLRAQLFMAINERFSVAHAYVDAIERFSNNASSVITGDFDKGGQQIIDTINDRISNLTDKMIEHFLPGGSLNSNTVLSLINAIYLNAKWYQDELFQQSLRWRPMAFRLEGGKIKNLTTFTGTVKAPYLEHNLFQLIKLPLKGHNHWKFGMYIVLPTVKEGTKFLDPLETFVKNDLLNKILNIEELKSEHVRVTIPEIAFEYEDDLVDDLKSLGIKDMFQRGRGDFSRITNSNALDLYVKEFTHKVAIGVDGNRVKAAAAVHASLQYRIGQPEPRKEFFADHPFLFYITVQQRKNNYLYEHVLFSGQFTGN